MSNDKLTKGQKIILKLLNFLFDGVDADTLFAKEEKPILMDEKIIEDDFNNSVLAKLELNIKKVRNIYDNLVINASDEIKKEVCRLFNTILSDMISIAEKLKIEDNYKSFTVVNNFNNNHIATFIDLYSSYNKSNIAFNREDVLLLNSVSRTIADLYETIQLDESIQIEANKRILSHLVDFKLTK